MCKKRAHTATYCHTTTMYNTCVKNLGTIRTADRLSFTKKISFIEFRRSVDSEKYSEWAGRPVS